MMMMMMTDTMFNRTETHQESKFPVKELSSLHAKADISNRKISYQVAFDI